MSAPDKRSPLKDKPLRAPGQSIDEQLEALNEKIIVHAALVSLLVTLTGVEWYRYYFPQPPHPIVYSVAAFLGIAYVTYRTWRELPTFRALRLGRDGERAVGQFLERLRESGYQVFHDVVGSGFNLDHVVIGPAGVFAVETKTLSKPARGQPKVIVDGQRILVDGLEPGRDPVVQAKAQASWLRSLLAESTGRKFPVRSVIVFPGWYVEQDRDSRREFWVLNPKALPNFLDNEPAVLSSEDVKLASFHLSRFIRGGEGRPR